MQHETEDFLNSITERANTIAKENDNGGNETQIEWEVFLPVNVRAPKEIKGFCQNFHKNQ